jgi:transcriptional regulator with XRE-family HTH domain/tetratricopeptide (TPR) repeat protein
MQQATMTRRVASQMRRLRVGRGWSAQRLADECALVGCDSLTRVAIAKLESGARKSVTAEEVNALARALDVTPTDLLTPKRRTVLVVDVARFTNPARTMLHQLAVREGLLNVLEGAFSETGVELDSCEMEDRGDGKLILMPPGVDNTRLADQLPDRLLAGLRRHNAVHAREAQVKLRVALHEGDVEQYGRGFMGVAVNLAFRLVEAPDAKTILASTPCVLALIASDDFYQAVIAQNADAEPGSYQQLSVSVKETSVVAWLRTPGHTDAPSVLDLWPARAREPANLDSTEAGADPMTEGTAIDPSSTHPTPSTGFAPVTPHEKPAADVPAVWGNVPARNPNFTGRVELLDQLNERLTVGGATAVLPAALHGMGGIGKTQMAVEYIYQHLREYDIVWWIQATEQAQIRAGLTELAQRLGLPGSAEAHTAVHAVQEALRIGQPFQNWLLVFDSAESPEIVGSFFPTNGPGHILVTSRNPAWVDIARPLEVTVFKRAESKELLRRRGPEIEDEDADRLAEALGDLPLAIAQAAAWRAETGMPVSEYLRLFNEKVAEILDTSSPAGYEVSLAAAWNVSFDELLNRNPAAHQLLQVCAFFAPKPISRSLFENVRGVNIAPELDAALRNPMQFGRTIRDINRYALAKIDHRNNTIQLHRLVQLVLSSRMNQQRAAEMNHGAHLLLANFAPSDPVPSKQWPSYQIVLPHAYAAKVIECDDSWARQLVINLMRFLYYWGDHQEAASLARQAVDVWSEKLGEADPQTLQAARNLGFYLWTLGQYAEAAEVNQRTVVLHRQVSGEDSEETVLAELAVATDLKGKGDFLAALDLNEQIHQKAKGLFGDDDPTTLLTAHDHVVSLGLAGQYQKGRELGELVYQHRMEVLGYDNPSTMSTLNATVLARREAGDYVWARKEQEQVAERSSTLFGADKAATLRRFHHLAVARRKAGDHHGALELSAQVMNSFHLRYGKSHPNAMACALAQSIDLRHADQLESARKLSEETAELYRRSLGEHHPHTVSALVVLAVTLRLLGDAGNARQLDERSLEQFRTMLGADHPYSIVSAINLASDLAALGETEAALKLDTEALERANRVLGVNHPTSLAALANIVLDLRNLGRTQEAETKYADVVTRYRKVLGDSHPSTMAAASGHRADCDIDPLPL